MISLHRRTGLGRFNPHQFRSLMVDMFMKYCGNNALDKASKFLGHKSTVVTYRNYWRTDVEQLANGIPFFKSNGTARNVDDYASTNYGSLFECEVLRRKQLERKMERMEALLTTEQRALLRHQEKLQTDDFETDGSDDDTTPCQRGDPSKCSAAPGTRMGSSYGCLIGVTLGLEASNCESQR